MQEPEFNYDPPPWVDRSNPEAVGRWRWTEFTKWRRYVTSRLDDIDSREQATSAKVSAMLEDDKMEQAVSQALNSTGVKRDNRIGQWLQWIVSVAAIVASVVAVYHGG